MSTFNGEDIFFGPPKIQEAYDIRFHIFLIFDGKQHSKTFLVLWMLKSTLISVLLSCIGIVQIHRAGFGPIVQQL